MLNRTGSKEHGFTLLESALVVVIIGIVAAFATPKITNALREYRMQSTMRRLADLMQQAKIQAVADNRRASLIIDTEKRRMGLHVFDNAGNLLRTDYANLPEGVSFSMPQNVSAPMTGAPTTKAVSFPSYNSSTTIFKQDFTSRGFPAVTTTGQINAIYVGNGRNFCALTLNSVGGIRTYRWASGRWESGRK
jgi:prepilin-type N-terminal cleavage/methylation domain-containing protein